MILPLIESSSRQDDTNQWCWPGLPPSPITFNCTRRLQISAGCHWRYEHYEEHSRMVSNEGMMKHNRKKMDVLPQTHEFPIHFLVDSLSCIIKCTHPLLQYEHQPSEQRMLNMTRQRSLTWKTCPQTVHSWPASFFRWNHTTSCSSSETQTSEKGQVRWKWDSTVDGHGLNGWYRASCFLTWYVKTCFS